MEGPALVEMILELSGLPKDWARTELRFLAERKGLSLETLQLDQIRDILAERMQEVLLSAKQEVDGEVREPTKLSLPRS